MSQKNKLVLISGLTLIIVSLLLSNNSDPGNPYLFSIKRSQEKVFEKLQYSNEQKLNFKLGLLNNRITELESIVKNQDYTKILNSSLRYSTTAGEITNLIISGGFENDTNLMQEIFSNHQKILQELIDNYPQYKNEEWKYLLDDINYLKIYKEELF